MLPLVNTHLLCTGHGLGAGLQCQKVHPALQELPVYQGDSKYVANCNKVRLRVRRKLWVPWEYHGGTYPRGGERTAGRMGSGI